MMVMTKIMVMTTMMVMATMMVMTMVMTTMIEMKTILMVHRNEQARSGSKYIPVLVWRINSVEQMAWLMCQGVDGEDSSQFMILDPLSKSMILILNPCEHILVLRWLGLPKNISGLPPHNIFITS